MTEAEHAKMLADDAEERGWIDISETHEAEELRIWIKGARLLAAGAQTIAAIPNVIRTSNGVTLPDGVYHVTVESGRTRAKKVDHAPTPPADVRERVARAIREAPLRRTVKSAGVIDETIPLTDDEMDNADAALAAIREAGFEIVRRRESNPCCFDIPGSDRQRGRDEPCGVCPEKDESAKGAS